VGCPPEMRVSTWEGCPPKKQKGFDMAVKRNAHVNLRTSAGLMDPLDVEEPDIRRQVTASRTRRISQAL
jgi:hypothetical protein